MPSRPARVVGLLCLLPAGLRAQDSVLTRLLVANRHSIPVEAFLLVGA